MAVHEREFWTNVAIGVGTAGLLVTWWYPMSMASAGMIGFSGGMAIRLFVSRKETR